MVDRTPGKKWTVHRWKVYEYVGLDVFAWEMPLSEKSVTQHPHRTVLCCSVKEDRRAVYHDLDAQKKETPTLRRTGLEFQNCYDKQNT